MACATPDSAPSASRKSARAFASASGLPLAYSAPTPAAVEPFHRAALQAGGHDNGPAGLRPDYGDCYYAAFVLDPHGHRLEAVTKQAQA